jgi:hypothetical protein
MLHSLRLFLALLIAVGGRSEFMLLLGNGIRLPRDVLELLGKGRHLQLATQQGVAQPVHAAVS